MCNKNINGVMGCQQNTARCTVQTLAIMSVPMQYADFDKLYTPEKALGTGTIFPELDLPYYGERRTK